MSAAVISATNPSASPSALGASPGVDQMMISPRLVALSSRATPKLGTNVGNEWNCAVIILASSPLAEAPPRFAEGGPSYDHDAGR